MKSTYSALAAVVALLALLSLPSSLRAQLFKNLEAFGSRYDVGDPEVDSEWQHGREGPKGLASGDLDGDGMPDLAVSNLDGTVSVLLNRDGVFADAVHLRTDTKTLRDIQIADFTGDGVLDIVTASIVDGELVFFPNVGDGGFGPPTRLETWAFGRDIAVGDFNGDGMADLAVGGCSVGVRQLKGLGDGSFELVRDFDDFAYGERSKPVYSFATVRRPGSTRDDLFVTHARTNRVCALMPDAAGVLQIAVCSGRESVRPRRRCADRSDRDESNRRRHDTPRRGVHSDPSWPRG